MFPIPIVEYFVRYRSVLVFIAVEMKRTNLNERVEAGILLHHLRKHLLRLVLFAQIRSVRIQSTQISQLKHYPCLK